MAAAKLAAKEGQRCQPGLQEKVGSTLKWMQKPANGESIREPLAPWRLQERSQAQEQSVCKGPVGQDHDTEHAKVQESWAQPRAKENKLAGANSFSDLTSDKPASKAATKPREQSDSAGLLALSVPPSEFGLWPDVSPDEALCSARSGGEDVSFEDIPKLLATLRSRCARLEEHLNSQDSERSQQAFFEEESATRALLGDLEAALAAAKQSPGSVTTTEWFSLSTPRVSVAGTGAATLQACA